MRPRHLIDKEYNTDPRHIKQWEMTLDYLMKFGIEGKCLDCGDRTKFTGMIEALFRVKVENTKHDLNFCDYRENPIYENIFIFEVIEHLLNPLLFLKSLKTGLMNKNGSIYLSTPYNKPNWMRNKERHFHEFNYNELCHLIDVAGFKIVDKKIINPTTFTVGFRPILRMLGIGGRNVLLRLKRK